MARAALEIGARLVARGALRAADDVRHLRWDELDGAVRRRRALVPTIGRAPSATRRAARPLPARRQRPPVGGRRGAPARRGGRNDGAVGAGGGTVTAPVHVHDGSTEVPTGHVLVVGHLDPRLAAVIPRLGGLIAETGSPLSHLAILAREHGVPTSSASTDATTRFVDGDVVAVDGHAGTVSLVDPEPVLDRVEVAA